MKKVLMLIAITMSLLIVMALSFTRCMAAEEVKPVTLRCGVQISPISWHGELIQWWVNEVEKRTGGKVKVQVYYMDSLFKQKDSLTAIKSGIADVGWLASSYFPSDLPLLMTIDNIFNIREDLVAALQALNETLDSEPNVKDEMERQNIILVTNQPGGAMFIGLQKCFNSIADLKGKTIRTYGAARIRYYQDLGANPVFLPYSDIYEAMSRGTIDGFDMVPLLSSGFKHQEIIKCLYKTKVGGVVAAGIFMNLKVFKNLPKDVQKVFLTLRDEYAVRLGEKQMTDEDRLLEEWGKKYGVKALDLTPGDQKINIEAGKKGEEYFLAKQESEGHKAVRKVWEYYKKTLKKYEDQRAKKG